MPSPGERPDYVVNTLIVGAGQAGLAASYWLSRAGVEHLLLERRDTTGGAWQDRWDAFLPEHAELLARAARHAV
jgi:putative flavoprotein involved in K+ transport